MNVLYKMIHDRTLSSYIGEPITVENYKLWVKHWFAVAEQYKKEFTEQGLPETAHHLGKIIEDQKKLLGDKYV